MQVRDEVISKLWFGRDPFADLVPTEEPRPVQGWNSTHDYLAHAVATLRPRLVVEIGVWKGASVITLAERMRDLGLDGVVIAVDTWLGSTEHWLEPRFFADLDHAGGYPRLYQHFAANVAARGLGRYVVPLPLDSASAVGVLAARGLVPDILHIDAGHDYASVVADLTRWWPLLRPGGLLVGDDYFEDGIAWPSVKAGFDSFFAAMPIARFDSGGGKCLVAKPGIGESGQTRPVPGGVPPAEPVAKIAFALGRATRSLLARK